MEENNTQIKSQLDKIYQFISSLVIPTNELNQINKYNNVHDCLKIINDQELVDSPEVPIKNNNDPKAMSVHNQKLEEERVRLRRLLI